MDIVIIGAGVIGSSIARELSKYDLKICVLEKGSDVAVGTSKANSGIVHAGHDAKPNTLKGKLNAKGNAMFDRLSKELDFPFKRNGSLVLCFDEGKKDALYALKKQGEKNGVPELEVISREEILKIEPNVSERVVAALHAPTGGIVCPYEMTIAYAENANTNGVKFYFNTEVRDIEKRERGFIVKTNQGDFESNLVINAAGVFADSINNMVSENKIKITPRRGEYLLFDKSVGDLVQKTLFQLPTKMGKGVLSTPTVDGNLLLGPTAEDIEDKSGVSTTREGLELIFKKAKLVLKEVPRKEVITSFAGLRAHSENDDFIVEEAKDVDGFINVAGIESPGLSSAPAIAEMVENMVVDKLGPSKKANFNPIRSGIPKFREMSNEERRALIQKDSFYGKIICRCEMVTEGEILNAIRRPLGARNLDAIKRRTRAGMGRCQSGFCTPKVIKILAQELNLPEEEVTKFGGNSSLIIGENKEL